MKLQLFFILVILVNLAQLVTNSPITASRKSELNDDFDFNQINEGDERDNRNRDKRKVELAVGVKNAILGFIFGKVNSFIDQKTQWVTQLDQTNIVKNKIHGIDPPKPPLNQLANTFQSVFNRKVNAIGPTLNVLTNKLSASNGLIANLGNFLSSSSALKQSIVQLPSNIGQATDYQPSIQSHEPQLQLDTNLNLNSEGNQQYGADFAAYASV